MRQALEEAIKLLKWCKDGHNWPLAVHVALTVDITRFEQVLEEEAVCNRQ